MTEAQRLISRKYIVYRMLSSMWFVGVVWLYFYRLFITDQQIGLVDGMAFAVGLIAEVPSGALADKFGRDKMVRIGQLLAGGGLLFQVLGTTFVPFFIGQAITMIGVSFVSGADEALFFDKLKFDRASTEWRKLVAQGSQAALIGTLLATMIGGWLHTIDPRLPWYLTTLTFMLVALYVWPIKDTRPRSARQDISSEIKEYLGNIRTGFAQFHTNALRLYLPIILVMQALFYTIGFGILRIVLLDRFHFSPFGGSIVAVSSMLITVGALSLLRKNADKIGEKQMITAIAMSAALGLLFAVFNIGVWGYLVIVVFYLGEYLLHPFMSEILNNQAPDDQRATVLSMASFLRALPYVGLAPLIGYLNTRHNLEYFLIGWAILIAIATMLYLAMKKRDTKVSIENQQEFA
jgi:MFS family permease